MKSGKKFLFSVLTSGNVSKAVCSNLNDMLLVIPELKSMIGFEHKHPHHHLDVWQHTLLALSNSPNNFDVRLALLLHDISKPECFKEENGIRHFEGHAEESAKMAEKILTRMTYEPRHVDYICQLIALHDTPLTKDFIKQKPLLSKTLFEIQKCDALAHNPEYNEKRLKYIDDITKLFKDHEQAQKEKALGSFNK